MPGFFDNLRARMSSTQQQPQGQQGNQGQGNNPQGQQPQGQGNNNPQSQSGNNPQTQTGFSGNPTAGISNDPASLLDAHKDLYTPSTTNPEAVPEFNLAEDKLDGVVKSQDFMKDVNPELLQKIQSGDMSALGEIINHATRNAYRSALSHGSALTGKFVDARFGHFDKSLGGRIKTSQLEDHLSKTPNFSNPIVRQQLTEIVTKLQQKHPEAPYEDVIEEGKRILGEVANSINPREPDPKAKQPMDWEAFMTQ